MALSDSWQRRLGLENALFSAPTACLTSVNGDSSLALGTSDGLITKRPQSELSGFCDTINIRSSSGLPPYILLLPCHGDAAALDQQDWRFHTSQPFEDDTAFWVGQFRVLDLGLDGS